MQSHCQSRQARFGAVGNCDWKSPMQGMTWVAEPKLQLLELDSLAARVSAELDELRSVARSLGAEYLPDSLDAPATLRACAEKPPNFFATGLPVAPFHSLRFHPLRSHWTAFDKNGKVGKKALEKKRFGDLSGINVTHPLVRVSHEKTLLEAEEIAQLVENFHLRGTKRKMMIRLKNFIQLRGLAWKKKQVPWLFGNLRIWRNSNYWLKFLGFFEDWVLIVQLILEF